MEDIKLLQNLRKTYENKKQSSRNSKSRKHNYTKELKICYLCISRFLNNTLVLCVPNEQLHC